MRLSSIFVILLGCLLVGCEKRLTRLDELCLQGTNEYPDACSILVENVELNRRLLDGKQLDIIGFMEFRHHFMGVYPTRDHSVLGLTRSAVRVRTPHDDTEREKLVSLNGRAVRIIGTFINDGRVGIPEWAGSIKVDKIDILPPEPEVKVNPLIEFESEQ
jgi:hypothetical protein